MLVLVFSNSEEGSVNNVIDHLIYMGAEVLRITENDIIIIKKIILDQDNFEIEFVVKNINVKYSDIFSVWFRQISQITIQDYEKSANTTVNNFLKNEIASLKEFFISALENKKCLGRYALQNANKLLTLKLAKSIGFLIPKTIVTEDYREVNYNAITKSIQDIFIQKFDSYIVTNYVSQTDYLDFDIDFGLSLFQINIKKSVPIRVFYVEDEIFSFKLLSSNYKVDSRLNEDRVVHSCKLPNSVCAKIRVFSQRMKCNTGSIDLLFDEMENKYYFLELNPVGQFGFLSLYTFGYLDKIIAKFLLSE